MMKQPKIDTKRLTLEPFNLADAPDVQNLANNWNIAKMTLNIPYPYEDGLAERWILSTVKGWHTRQSASFAIKTKISNQLLGAMSLVEISGDQAELGYWIGESFWNQGYCCEAANAIVAFSFESLGLTKITAEHLTSNPASGRVMQKIGMNHVLSTKKSDRNGGKAMVEVYEITRG